MPKEELGSCSASRRAFLLIFATVFASAATIASSLAALQDRPSQPAVKAAAAPPFKELEQAIFESVNRERAVRGLQTLRSSDDLAALARQHSEDMAGRGLLAHHSSAGKSYTQRLTEARIVFAANGENVANSHSFDPKLVHEALMKSGGHRENILNPAFDALGVGIFQGPDGVIYVTQDFIKSVAVLHETSKLDRIDAHLRGHVSGMAYRKVGISVRRGGRVEAFSVNVLVILLLAS